jgi:hypothetical protein
MAKLIYLVLRRHNSAGAAETLAVQSVRLGVLAQRRTGREKFSRHVTLAPYRSAAHVFRGRE